MSQRIVKQQNCDWHEQLDEPEQILAVHTRINPAGKENDLCEVCCMIFDLVMPRLKLLLAFFKPEVIERLLSVGRDPAASTSERRTAQLAIPGAQAAIKQPTAKKGAATKNAAATTKTAAPPEDGTDGRKEAVANRGRRKPKTAQVRCPLPHTGANSPKEYWVDVRNRGSHAKSSHQALGPEVPYELPSDSPVKLDVKCFEHVVCAKAGGYGFTNAAGLAMHLTKANSEGWERVPKDAAATSEAAAPEAA